MVDVAPQTNTNTLFVYSQTIYAATKYSTYLGLVGLASGKTPQESAIAVKSKLWPTLTTGWRFWPAVHLVTYNLIPPR